MVFDKTNLEVKARNGNALDRLMLGAVLINQGDSAAVDEGLDWVKKAAKECEEANVYLGILYRIGHKVPKNESLAKAYFQKYGDSDVSQFHWCLGELIMNVQSKRMELDDIFEALMESSFITCEIDPFIAFIAAVLTEKGIPGCRKPNPYVAIYNAWKAAKKGYGPGKEYFEALYHRLLLEAKNGSLPAQYAIADLDLWEVRNTDEKKKEEGIALLHSLAKQNYPDALQDLGHYYMSGYVVDKDRKRALEFYRKAAVFGPAEYAMEYCNLIHDKELNREEKEQFAITLGNNEAKYQYWRCESSPWAKTSPEKLSQALQWLKEAADEGYPPANESLGDLYLQGGYGVEQDFAKARQCYEKCIGTDSHAGVCALAKMYIKGEGGEADSRKGLALLDSVRASGDYYADVCLGELYQHGIGLPKNPEKAFELFDSAYAHGESVHYRDDLLKELEEAGIKLRSSIKKSSGIALDPKLLEILNTAYQEELHKLASNPDYLFEKLRAV